MKKIFVLAYLRNNLGDDMFVIELLNRYPNVDFYIGVTELKYAKAFLHKNNAKIIINKKENFQNIDIYKYDGYVYIGGSIFMEGGKVYNLDENCFNFMKKCNLLNKPFYYISSNYGPYQTKKYFELSEQTFELCTDLCFRDVYSYKLFKNIPTVRYAPDAVFSYDIGQLNKEKNSIGISIIDLEIRENLKYKENQYIEFLINNIKSYLKSGKKIYLFSFCNDEGDEKTIDKIFNKIELSKYRDNIKRIEYTGNIEEFLNIYKKMEYMICQRFHSVILSYLYEQKFYIISYSKKICNVIKELDLCSQYLKLEEITAEKNINIEDFFEINKEKLKKIKKDSQEQFRELDKFLK